MSKNKDRNFYYLVVDLEATCSEDGAVPRDEMEIIEIGGVMLNRSTWQIDSEFQQFIKPVRNPHLKGTHHRGIDDARNIASIFKHIKTSNK